MLVNRVKTYNSDAAPNIKEMHLVRPIPQIQIDRVSNPGDFLQNEGYKLWICIFSYQKIIIYKKTALEEGGFFFYFTLY